MLLQGKMEMQVGKKEEECEGSHDTLHSCRKPDVHVNFTAALLRVLHVGLSSPFCPLGYIPADAGRVTADFRQILPSAVSAWSPD